MREREPATRAAEHAAAPRRGERRLHRRDRVRIFGADVDVALGRADRDAGDRHAFDQDERIAFHDHAVGEGAAVAFVGVADDVFLRAPRLRDRAPLDAGREAGAAATAQARLDHLFDDRRGPERKRALEPLVAAMGAVVVERARIDDAAAREGQPGLPLEPGNVVGQTEAQRMRPAGNQGIEQARGIAAATGP